MKKVSFLMIAAFVAVCAMFVSCGGDDPGSVVITLDATEVESNGAITGLIKSTNPLTKASLLKEGSTVTGWPKTSFTANPINGKDGDYNIRIDASELTAGEYTLEAEDGDGVKDSKKFTVKAPVDNSETFSVKLGGPTSSEGSFLSIKNKAAYKTSATAAELGAVEIVFNGSKFISASESANTTVKGNGNTATITGTASPFTYTTSTGYEGTLTVDGSMSGDAATITVEVKRTETAK